MLETMIYLLMLSATTLLSLCFDAAGSAANAKADGRRWEMHQSLHYSDGIWTQVQGVQPGA